MARGTRRVRFRRRRRCGDHENDPPPSACVRRRQGRRPSAVKGMWEDIKAEEKAEAKAGRSGDKPASALDGVPVGLPALTRALKLQQKAGKRRLRLERSAGGAGQDPRRSRRDRGRTRSGRQPAAEAGRRSRRSAVRAGQSCAPSRRRSGRHAARAPTPSSSGASPRSRLRWRQGQSRRTRRSPRWMRCGTRRRRRRSFEPSWRV